MGKKVEIIFYGMACFDPHPKRCQYRVVFPNALKGHIGVPPHSVGIWVRDRKTKVTNFDWPAAQMEKNDFFLDHPSQLKITGAAASELQYGKFERRVINLKKCDKHFEIDEPDYVIDMTVDRGKLSAHFVNKRKMIVVRWEVDRETGSPLRFIFDDRWLEIPAKAIQVYIANVAFSGDGSHFRLYRRLQKGTSGGLKFVDPQENPLPIGTVTLKAPTYRYSAALARKLAGAYKPGTPEITCSPVQSTLNQWGDS